MDPFSITTGCLAIVTTIGQLSLAITNFVRQARHTRHDLDAVSGELGSLRTVLEMIAEDFASPNDEILTRLGSQIDGLLKECDRVLAEIAQLLSRFGNGSIVTASQWAISGKSDVDRLRSSLEAHKTGLSLALDVANL